jgi:hypothetical protein
MAKTPENTYRIVRQDNNGNMFVARENLCETAAKLFLQRFEAQIGFHHQGAWTQPMSVAAPGPLISVRLRPVA